MRASTYARFGSVDVLEVRELPEPPSRAGEARVRVHAAALNPKDVLLRRGKMRWLGPARFPRIPGYDFAGVLMDPAGDLAVGTEVFGMVDSNYGGACAEVVRVPVDELAAKPAALSMVEAAALPLVGLTALQGLRDELELRRGDRILLNGASGGVGTVAIQIAALLGGRVTAVCSGRNRDLVTVLGARQVIDYTRGDYATALMKGRSDPQATEAMLRRVTELTGLPADYVRRAGGRLETQAYLREVFRDKGVLGSRYDSNVTAFDPFPTDPEQRTNDPLLDGIIAPTTTAMVDFVTRVAGWKTDARYEALSYAVNGAWDRDESLREGAVTQLRQSAAIDPKLQVLIAHGWNDLSCPFMGSVLAVDQMPPMGGDAGRVRVREYPGGHMFYSRPDSQARFKADVRALYGRD